MSSSLIAAWSLAGVLAVIGLATARLERWAYGPDTGPRRKLLAYGITIAAMWALAAAATGISGWARLVHSPAPLTAWLPASRVTGPALGVVAAAYVILCLLPLLQSLRGPRWRAAYAAATRRAFATLPGLLPDTAAERAAFLLVGLSAGVCEELLYRGFLIRLLHDGALGLPLAGALAASSLVFGLGHAYQGPRGVLSTTLCGLALGLVFLLTGSLIPSMVLHALMDMQLVYVLRPGAHEPFHRAQRAAAQVT